VCLVIIRDSLPTLGLLHTKNIKKLGLVGRLFIISSLLAWTTSVEVGLFMFTPNLMMLASLNSFFGMCQKYKIKKRKEISFLFCRLVVFLICLFTVEAVGESDSQRPHTRLYATEDSYSDATTKRAFRVWGGTPANKQMKQSRA
jgi:hypothetical protein